jgi:hypothetical protein
MILSRQELTLRLGESQKLICGVLTLLAPLIAVIMEESGRMKSATLMKFSKESALKLI